MFQFFWLWEKLNGMHGERKLSASGLSWGYEKEGQEVTTMLIAFTGLLVQVLHIEDGLCGI